MGMSLKQRAKSKSSFQKTFASTASLEGLPYEILSIILELLIPERGPICEESRRYLRYNEPLGLLALNRCNRSMCWSFHNRSPYIKKYCLLFESSKVNFQLNTK